jgi:uncharacterized membrane protein
MLQQVVVSVAIVVIGAVLGANVYNSVVDAPNWGASIPASLAAAKHYFVQSNPAMFFRVASPLAQFCGLAAVVVCWSRGGSVRWIAVLGLALVVLGDALTFAYFYPRNAILFGDTVKDPALLTAAWREWSVMNHVRTAVVVAALACELVVLGRLG